MTSKITTVVPIRIPNDVLAIASQRAQETGESRHDLLKRVITDWAYARQKEAISSPPVPDAAAAPAAIDTENEDAKKALQGYHYAYVLKDHIHTDPWQTGPGADRPHKGEVVQIKFRFNDSCECNFMGLQHIYLYKDLTPCSERPEWLPKLGRRPDPRNARGKSKGMRR